MSSLSTTALPFPNRVDHMCNSTAAVCSFAETATRTTQLWNVLSSTLKKSTTAVVTIVLYQDVVGFAAPSPRPPLPLPLLTSASTPPHARSPPAPTLICYAGIVIFTSCLTMQSSEVFPSTVSSVSQAESFCIWPARRTRPMRT